MTAIEQIEKQQARIKALEAELARKQTATAPAVKTRAELEAEYAALPSTTVGDAQVRAAFRAKYRKELAL